ncbi:MAG: hypothetical protein AAFW75_01900 [Cyanobacteria bacterium J06636_16]
MPRPNSTNHQSPITHYQPSTKNQELRINSENPMQYFTKYLTSAPIMATIALVVLTIIMVELNLLFPGLQYGTYFHTAP